MANIPKWCNNSSNTSIINLLTFLNCVLVDVVKIVEFEVAKQTTDATKMNGSGKKM